MITNLLLLALVLPDGGTLAVNSAMTCEPITADISLDDLQERLRLEWMSKTDMLTGHTAIVDTAAGGSTAIESITESAVSTYQADSGLRFYKVNNKGSEWLCVSQ